jgi:hypothetical protein
MVIKKILNKILFYSSNEVGHATCTQEALKELHSKYSPIAPQFVPYP